MEDYKTLLRLSVCHEYFERKTNEMIKVRLFPESLILLKNRQLIFKRETGNQWVILGNMEGAGVDEENDVIGMDFILRDTAFFYYTKWEKYDARVSYLLDLSGPDEDIEVTEQVQTMTEKKAGILFTGKLKLSMDMYQRVRQGEPYEVRLNFVAKEMFWEYMFIPRKEEEHPRRLLLQEQNNELQFSEPELVQVGFTEKPVYRSLSYTRIKMKERYPYRLNLLEVVRENPEWKRKIIKNIEYPVPGQFYDVKENYLRKIVYY